MQREERPPEGGRRRGKWVWLAVTAIVLMAAVICGFWLFGDRRSADERLVEIEAARAIPDNQNAALIYNELLQDARATSALHSRPDVLNGPLFSQRRDEPWRTEDCPEVAAWIDECAHIFEGLAEASQLEACRFPISIDIDETSTIMERGSPMRQWAFLLLFAINNDLAEGRIDAAVTKWRCIIQMGNHLRQQPLLLDHILGNAMTELALKSMARFVAIGDPSSKHLQEIELMPLPLADDWSQHLKEIHVIDGLIVQKMKEPFSLWDRVRFPFFSYRMRRAMNKVPGMPEESPIEATGNAYRRNVATARGLHILIALRRHQRETGQWPRGLYEISSSLPKEILTDPLNGDSFVYRRERNAFKLYSKGGNVIDEYGLSDSEGADDWVIWQPPPPGEEAMLKQLEEIYGERYPTLKK